MCGLVGRVALGGIDRTALEPRLTAAIARLRPRGPDSQGSWADERCVFGHTRLAIVDLSPAGAQPMARAGLVITYNGEIYNFPALRAELQSLGHQFVGHSDTEVLLEGWREWGRRLLPRLEGMFAFALWDQATGELTLARDRFGKKPLLYSTAGDRLDFASELTALQHLAGSAGAIDPAALRLYFALRYVPEPWSILSGVRKLPAGHLASFSHRGLAIERWYEPRSNRLPLLRSEDEVAAELRARLDAAVERRLIADVPVGAFLSGGIDSAIVASAMTRHASRVRTFTVGFAGAAEYYEERPAARRVADYLGTEHTEIIVTPEETLRALDAVWDGLDEPFADSSALPQYMVARETRRHVTVALSGDGSDEVFGGYRKYQGELLALRCEGLPTWLKRALLAPLLLLPEGKSHPLLERARRLRRFAAHGWKTPTGRQAGWGRNLGERELDALLVEKAAAPTVEALVAELRGANGRGDPINAMLAADLGLGLVGDMLVKVDRMSMANSLEVRCPYLDSAVVECAAAMPGRFKLAPGEGKRVLRRAFAERLPAEVFARPKKGFEIPIADWLKGDLADLARRATDPARLRRQGLFRPELPQRWLRALAGGRRDCSERLWTLIAFQSWWERRQAA
ncbi:MAG TPA: asparagine synthase (glutamine-hydrolyzing) [Alphaproteobacteria bacterium]|nr:asparagine synthase (glutamine-hydrolyzing) [Alphaproteobacteria bacterium]